MKYGCWKCTRMYCEELLWNWYGSTSSKGSVRHLVIKPHILRDSDY